MSTPAATIPARRATRSRSAVVEVENTDPQADLKALAVSVYTANTAMNAAKAKHDSARKALYAAMIQRSLKQVQATADVDGKSVALEATIESKKQQGVDVDKLAKEVSLDTLLKIVSASGASVKEFAGRACARQGSCRSYLR